MSDPREQLKAMVQDIINDRQEQADATLHSYLLAKTQQLTGLSSTEVPGVDDSATE